MVFLAAVHDELLREPDDELAAYYPTVGGRRAPDAALGAALARFCAAREEPLAATLATRRTQTNEVARCAGLLPAFAAVAGGRPLAQIEIGASAGLNGLWDHYAYDYAGRAAGDAGLAAADRLRAARRRQRRRSTRRRWRGAPGIDLSPVDLPTPPTSRWLRACLWPDQPARHARFEAALAVAHEHGPVDVRRGDALAAPPGRDRVGAGGRARVRVPHRRARLLHARAGRRAARAAGERRARRRLDRRRGAGHPRRRAARARRVAATSRSSAGRPGRLAQVARMGHHGGWLEWLLGSGVARARSGRWRRRSRSGERLK